VEARYISCQGQGIRTSSDPRAQALRKYMDAAYDVSCRRPVLAKHKVQWGDCKLNLRDSRLDHSAVRPGGLPLLFL
jgi:hypothetical protein